MTDPPLFVETSIRIETPADAVFEALVNPAIMAKYFISSGSGRLDDEAPVEWRWEDVGARAPVTPVRCEAPRTLAFRWGPPERESLVELSLVPDGPAATKVHVREGEWSRDQAGHARALEQMGGWVHMLCCLRGWLDFGVNLRAGGLVEASGS